MDNLSSNDEGHKSKIYAYIEKGIISTEIFVIVLLIGIYLQTPILRATGFIGIILSLAMTGYWNLKLFRPDLDFIQKIIYICCVLTFFLFIFGGVIYGSSTGLFNKSAGVIYFVLGIMTLIIYQYYKVKVRNNKIIVLLLLLLIFLGIIFIAFFVEEKSMKNPNIIENTSNFSQPEILNETYSTSSNGLEIKNTTVVIPIFKPGEKFIYKRVLPSGEGWKMEFQYVGENIVEKRKCLEFLQNTTSLKNDALLAQIKYCINKETGEIFNFEMKQGNNWISLPSNMTKIEGVIMYADWMSTLDTGNFSREITEREENLIYDFTVVGQETKKDKKCFKVIVEKKKDVNNVRRIFKRSIMWIDINNRILIYQQDYTPDNLKLSETYLD